MKCKMGLFFAQVANLVEIKEQFSIAAKEAIRANIITIVETPHL